MVENYTCTTTSSPGLFSKMAASGKKTLGHSNLKLILSWTVIGQRLSSPDNIQEGGPSGGFILDQPNKVISEYSQTLNSKLWLNIIQLLAKRANKEEVALTSH